MTKRCGCGAVYRTLEDFRALESAGTWSEGGEVIELRNCSACRSTIALVLVPHPTDVRAELDFDEVTP